MSEELFPSGPWLGFYNYRPGDRHRMDLHLAFANGSITGGGNDDVGGFLIKGRYEASTRECHWTKSYMGAHDVFYRGFREGKGIWGTWEIGVVSRGGFHIWPRSADEAESWSESTREVGTRRCSWDVSSSRRICWQAFIGAGLIHQDLIPTMHIHLLENRCRCHVKPFSSACLLGLTLLAITSAPAASPDWPQFRGPNSSGVAAKARPPVQIGPTNNVLWIANVPWSPSSPCVSGNRIFLTTYADGEFQTCCYAAKSGKFLWSRNVRPEKLELFHNSEGSPAAATPATDGRHVVSYFGSFGLVGYDLKGQEIWRHPLPVAVSGGSFGSGTSPIIVRNHVILNRDQDQNSSLLALEVATGKTVWETPRSEAHGSFGTPIIWRNSGIDEIIAPGSVRLNAYDLKNGREQWALHGVPGLACTTPVVGDGLLFFAGWSPGKSDSPRPSWSSFLSQHDKNGDGEVTLDEADAPSRDFLRGLDVNHDGKITKADYDLVTANDAKAENVLVAIRPGGRGDISQTHVAWKVTRGLPYVPSPLFYDGRVYIVRDGGMMSSFDAKTGKVFYQQERLEATDKYYASPVAADGRIYVVSVPGRLTVVKAGGDKPEILYQANFGERIFATPALTGSRFYLRTQTKLYAFGK